MTALATKLAGRPHAAGWAARRKGAAQSPSLFDGGGGGPTLDEFLTGVWEELTAHTAVPCPVCDGRMERESPAAHAGRLGGRCADCGTTLS
jgi:hypothetical protein